MNAGELRTWLITRIAATLRVDPSDIDDRAPFDSFGLSSTDAVTMSGDLEELLGRDLSPTLVYEYPSITALARHLGGAARPAPSTPPSDGSAGETPVAIVGIGCRFPGANDPEAYWRLLRDGVDAIREVPADRWDARAVYDPDPSVPGKTVTRWGGFLDAVDRFDAFFFGISPGEAERMDPQQRLLLELAYESFEDAGASMARLAGTRTGVFVGIAVNEYGFRQFDRHESITGHSGTGNALSIAANRVSYFFDLRGPSLAVDTACSSSLTALHLACRSLRSGECDLAVAGGVNVALAPAHAIAFTKAGVLSPDGRCKVFDARADGYVRGEGGGMVVLKPLARALADGDRIYCVIRGSAVRQDGRTNGLMAPSREAQEAVLRDAYRDARIPPSAVQYVEAHGTGTLLGDSIEARALGTIVGSGRANGPCMVGSVKSNLGHLEAAAGIAGLIKTALALDARSIPPSLHFATPNPHIPFNELGLRVQDSLAPWPEHLGTALAGVSSFGFGGTNVHVVLEEAPAPLVAPSHDAAPSDAADVLPLSAHSPAALVALARAFRDRLSGSMTRERSWFHDVCATAGRRRNHLDHRVALVACSIDEMIGSLDGFLREPAAPTAPAGRLVFVFSGQGSQWYGMGRELLRLEPSFARSLEECEQALRPHVDWSLREQLMLDESRSRLTEIDVIQPTLFALQVALANLWRSWGIVPDAVVGHSMGEVAAACIAGALTLEDAARVICERSCLLRRLSGHGGMAVVGLSAEDTARFLAGHERQLSIAASNGPVSTVVSGDVQALAALMARLDGEEIFCSAINVDVASHSPQTAPLGEELRHRLAELGPRTSSLPFISTVTGAALEGVLDAQYWARNLTEPVRFTEAIDALLRTGPTDFIEISPHPVLQSSVQQSLAHSGGDGSILSSTRRDAPERQEMLTALAMLYTSGRTVDWTAVHAPPRRPVSLPRYPWQRERYWLETAATPSPSSAPLPNDSTHPLLGHRLALAHNPGANVWQVELDADRLPFLRDHRVNGQAVAPASAFVEMALAAAAAWNGGPHTILDLHLPQRLVLLRGEPRTLQVTLLPGDDGRVAFSVHSRPVRVEGDDWTLHATATVVAERLGDVSEPCDLAGIRREVALEIPVADLYRRLAERGLEYGATMRSIERVWHRNGQAIGRISLTSTLRHEHDRYQIHPAILDGALQVIGATVAPSLGAGDDHAMYVPVGCRQVRRYRRPGQTVWSHVVVRSEVTPAVQEVEVDVHVLDDAGRAVADLSGLRLARTAAEARPDATARTEEHTWYYQVRWQEAEWPDPEATEQLAGDGSDRWLILADRDGVSDALQQHLEARGQHCTLLRLDGHLAHPSDDGLRDAIRNHFESEPAPLRGIVCLWSAGQEASQPESPERLREAQGLGCNAVLHLVQELVARGAAGGAPQLWLVTRGTQPVRADELARVTHAPLWGLGRTIGFELPELKCTLVDLDPGADASADASSLFRQLCVRDAEDQVALRAGRRWVPRLAPATVSASTPSCAATSTGAVRADGTYLITGGLGGLGLTVARWMVDRGAKHLVLVGRSAPLPAAAAALEDMRRRGTAVTVMSADVAAAADVRGVVEGIRESMPPLRGVVHAAGVLDNAAIVSLDGERLAKVLAPKVEGAWNLHRATEGEQLDFFVLFSSAVSVLGSPGQGNYAAANTFLDVLAHVRQREGKPAISINWGPWVDVGLVASGDFLPASAPPTADGIKGITPQQGLQALGRALMYDGAQLTVLPFDISSLLALYPTAAAIPFFADVGGEQTHVSRLYARPSLRQPYVAPRSDVERKLAELWRQTLRIDRVGIRDSFFELGGDSVLAAQIVTAAQRTFAVRIDPREAFQAFTIEHLAERIAAAGHGLAIAPRDPNAGPIPLSFVQERQLFLELLDPFTAVNNLSICVRMQGPLDLGRLTASANRLIARHASLRTSFDTSQGKPVAVVAPALAIELGPVNLTETESDPLAEALRLATEEAARPFELDRAPLLRVRMYRLAPDSHVMLVIIHHTIADGWSLGVFLRELFAAYHDLADPSAPPFTPLPIQYADFAAWQRASMDEPRLARQLTYWKEQLGGELPVLDLPTDRPRPARQTFAGATHRFRIPPALRDHLKTVSQAHDVTPFMTLFAGFQTLLHRWCAQDDILVGTPTAGRTQPETEQLIGAFINTLVLRTDLSGDPSFGDLLGRVRATALAAYSQQDLPFEKLVAELRPPRDLSRTPIFQVLFILQNSPLPDLRIPGLSFELLAIDRGTSQFDLTLMITESAGGLDGAIEYNTDLFDPSTIERFAEAYQLLLADAVAHPEKPLSTLAVMRDAERDHLVGGVNATRSPYPRDRRVHQLFEEQVARTPAATAVICGQATMTYHDLDRRAGALAADLRALSVAPGDCVGVCLDRSPDLVAALLAVQKTGAAYLPIDPETPTERVAFMLRDAGARVFLTDGCMDPWNPDGIAVQRVSHAMSADARESPPPAGPEDLAYVIYTSGSTGQPKGVRVRHQALVNLLWSIRQLLEFGTGDKLLAVTSVSFDISGLELYLPLIAGGTVVLATRDVTLDGRKLGDAIADHGVRFMQATPATWRLMLRAGWRGAPSLVALCGGEPLTCDLAEQLLERVHVLWNVYGPTETTIWSSAAPIRRGGRITIGRPIANTQLHVLDARRHPVPIGALGELYIGGDGVSPGYVGRPELTAERFVEDPFSQAGGARLFRTGDRARRLPDGNIEVLGRLDDQVKIHGFRIELGEIEAALSRHPAVREVGVVARESTAGDKSLIAYYVPVEELPVSVRDLRAYLRSSLPAYMVPAVFVALPVLPLTRAGKLDRRALAALNPTPVESEFVSPRTPLEDRLAATYAQVLGVDRVGIHENFFDLGGGSIQILEIIVRTEVDGMRLTPETFFEHQTVADLAAALSGASHDS